ncbi:MAG: hypothetical protein H6719_14540 [Sandaracinaceae bacterium]|nr:hypothetical protein [Sandaracinaceae bacterium]
MSKNLSTLLFAALLLSQACAAQPGGLSDGELGPEDLGSDGSALRVAPEDSSTYYALRQDFRRCAWPFCGGYWVHELNQDLTECADGTRAAECYVTDLDASALGLNERDFAELRGDLGALIFRGDFDTRFVEDRTIDYEVLAVDEAWRPLDGTAPTGDFLKVIDNGIRCFRAPCENQEAAFLNYPWFFLLDRLDLDASGATDEQLAAAWAALSDGGLLVAGSTRAVIRRRDIHLRIQASQIYLPVQASPASGPFCGGIAGFTCPGHGVCADDPSDGCDPATGGADCGGVCECRALLRCGPGYRWDGSPEVCACVDDSGISPCATVRCAADTTCEVHDGAAYCVSTGAQACGASTCEAGSVCCNASCGICTPPGGVCIQLACAPE